MRNPRTTLCVLHRRLATLDDGKPGVRWCYEFFTPRGECYRYALDKSAPADQLEERRASLDLAPLREGRGA